MSEIANKAEEMLKNAGCACIESGANIQWTLKQIDPEKHKDVVDTIQNEAVFRKFSVIKLALASKQIDCVKDVSVNSYHALVYNAILQNKYVWEDNLPSLRSLGRLLIYYLIIVIYSLSSIMAYGLKEFPLENLVSVYLSLPLLGIIIIVLIKDLLLDDSFMWYLISSVVIVGLLSKVVIPAAGNSQERDIAVIRYSLIWGCLGLLVAGIDTLSILSNHRSYESNRLLELVWSLANSFFGLAVGLSCIKFFVDIPTSLTLEYSVSVCDAIGKITLDTLISIPYLFLYGAVSLITFPRDLKVNEIRWRVIRFNFGTSVLTRLFNIIINRCFIISDSLKEPCTYAFLALVCFFIVKACKSFVKKNNMVNYPIELLYIPAIINIIPGCELCGGFVNNCWIVAFLFVLVRILLYNSQEDVSLDDSAECSQITYLKRIESFFRCSVSKVENLLTSTIDGVKKSLLSAKKHAYLLHSDPVYRYYRTLEYLRLITDYLKNAVNNGGNFNVERYYKNGCKEILKSRQCIPRYVVWQRGFLLCLECMIISLSKSEISDGPGTTVLFTLDDEYYRYFTKGNKKRFNKKLNKLNKKLPENGKLKGEIFNTYAKQVESVKSERNGTPSAVSVSDALNEINADDASNTKNQNKKKYNELLDFIAKIIETALPKN